MDDLNEAWNVLTSSCTNKETLSQSSLSSCLSIIHQHQFIPIFQEWFLDEYRSYLNDDLLPSFWSTILTPNCLLFAPFSQLHASIMTHWIENNSMILSFSNNQHLLADFVTKMKDLLRALLLTCPPFDFNDCLLRTYKTAFKVYQHDLNKSEKKRDKANSSSLSLSGSSNDWLMSQTSQPNSCPGCDSDQTQCLCLSISDSFHTFNHQLKDLNLLEVIASDAVLSVMHSFIENHISNKCSSNFDVSYIDSLKSWIEMSIMGFVRLVYEESKDEKDIKHIENRLNYFLYETFAHIRMQQLFDIIIEFPDSEESLKDLRECLEKCTNFRSKLIKSLKESLETRLLHPGVSTSDILAAYISAIKALRVLDPTGVILQLVCEPVRKYLKSRDDTVRCIITALTDDNSSDLTPELDKSNLATNDDNCFNEDGENIADNWKTWQPDPIDAKPIEPGTAKLSMRSSDIVSILVNIYESKDLFVEEYQRLLGQRLLTNFECNVEHERRNLELLTLRFGESDLHACEVMLKDVTDSKRISLRINTGEIEQHRFDKFPINALILSAQFWPEKYGISSLEDASGLVLPKDVTQATSVYNSAYETINMSRTLNWIPHLGLVQLELEFGEKKINFSVTPIQATIIQHFQDKDTWTINELSEVMSIPPSIIRRRIAFWQNKGIVKETKTDKFVLIEDQKINTSMNTSYANENMMTMEEDYDDDLERESGKNESEDKFASYWSWVHNMLNNLNSLPLERILTMLQMFAMQGSNSSELTTHELRHFLDQKVKENKLAYSGGQYKLPDTSS